MCAWFLVCNFFKASQVMFILKIQCIFICIPQPILYVHLDKFVLVQGLPSHALPIQCPPTNRPSHMHALPGLKTLVISALNSLALGKHCCYANTFVLSFGNILSTGQEGGAGGEEAGWGGWRILGLRADIPVTVRQVPVGEEGGPGELWNIIKEKKKEEME